MYKELMRTAILLERSQYLGVKFFASGKGNPMPDFVVAVDECEIIDTVLTNCTNIDYEDDLD